MHRNQILELPTVTPHLSLQLLRSSLCLVRSQEIVWCSSSYVWFSSPRCWIKLHSQFFTLVFSPSTLISLADKTYGFLRQDLNEGVVPAVINLKNRSHVPTTVAIVWCTEDSYHFLLLPTTKKKKKETIVRKES